MQLTTKYEMGQTVWSISHGSVERNPVACPACEDGTVELRGERYKCPRCDGKKTIHVKANGWIVSDRGAIGLVRADMKAPHWDQRWGDDYVKGGEMYVFVEYMLDSTGIGSGRVHHEPDLWPSREEAQAECDRRNGRAGL